MLKSWYEVSRTRTCLCYSLISVRHALSPCQHANGALKELVDLSEKVESTKSAIADARRLRIELRRAQYPFSALYRRMNSVIALQYRAPDHMVRDHFISRFAQFVLIVPTDSSNSTQIHLHPRF